MFSRFVFCVLAILFSSALCTAKTYDGYSVLQAFPNTKSKVDYLVSLEEEGTSGLEIQIWRPGNLNTSFDILVSPESMEALLKELDERQLRYEVTVENVQHLIEKEKKPQSPHTRALAGVQNAAHFTKYLNLDELYSFVQALATRYPNLVKIEQLGLSYERRPIYVVTVGSNTGRQKPNIWIDGGIHAREWISVSTVTYMLNKLVTAYSVDPKIKDLVDNVDWYIVPVLNVDGYEYTHTEDRMWRKNRRPAPCRGRGCCYGVDLNRNFDHYFAGSGTSPHSCDETYRGTAAFSEPETRAVRDFVLKHAGDMKAFITIHSYMQMWFYPYANKRKTYPEDIRDLAAVSKKAIQAIQSVGTEFRAGTPADILYAAAGSSMDWAKAVAKVKFCFALELRPGKHGNGFVLPPSHIVPAGEETWAGISVVADEVIKRFAS